MKKIIVSASLAALGATAVHAEPNAPGLTPMERSKPWSISATLRGFYDDNYTMLPHGQRQDSFGFEVSPGFSLNLPLDQTFIGLSYIYSLRWYEDREHRNDDQSHQFKARVNHKFSDRHKVDLKEAFVAAQEPELIDPSGAFPLRSEGDNMRNNASITFSSEFTPIFGLEFGYANTWYDYEQSGAGSYSSALDRMEHLFSLNTRWQIYPTTVGIIGYQYGFIDHLDHSSLLPFGPYINPNIRDNRSHYGYIGVDQGFAHNFSFSARVGVQYTEYFNSPAGNRNDDVSPYADVNGTWAYAEGSSIVFGARHARNQTDVVAPASTSKNFTLDQEQTTLYASWNHRITPKLMGSVIAQGSRGEFQDGAANNNVDYMFLAGVNLTYQFNQYWSAETGYNFDRLDSDIGGRSFTRNRVYIGVRATY